MTKRMVILLTALAMTACEKKDTGEPTTVAHIVEPQADSAVNVAEGAPPPASPATAKAAMAAAPTSATATIAYSYKLGFELPNRRLDAVVAAHRAACTALGARCQLLNSSRAGGDGDAAEASLDLRLVPAEVAPFTARITASSTAAGGTLLDSRTTGEDVTRQLIDADAALKAKRTLRDRLQTLLESHQGRLADLLEVEKSLSETQQALDTATAELAELRQRVSFSTLTITYRAEHPLGSTGRPLAEALANAGQTLATSLALLVTAALALLPWLVPIGGIVWLLARWRARRRARRPAG